MPKQPKLKPCPFCGSDDLSVIKADDALAASQQRVAKLRTALVEYGSHGGHCRLNDNTLRITDKPKWVCTCGFSAALAEDPEQDPDAATPDGDYEKLRKMLWLRHGCLPSMLYGDDGEMQCPVCGIDFKRDTVERIEERFESVLMRRIVTQIGLFDNPATRYERFEKFDAEHPEVYEKLVELCRQCQDRGITRYGIRALWERMRWHFRVDKGDNEFKLNDHFTSFYARKIISKNADLEGFFELRG